MPALLLELFSEEIPARMQARAAEDLRHLVLEALRAQGLAAEGAVSFAGPRRLALHICGLPARQPDTREEKRGPRIGATEAAEQDEIARSMGLRCTDKGTPCFPQFYTIQDELTYYGHLGDLVLQDYRQHPSSLLKAVSYNAAAFWIQGRTAKATLYNALLTIPYLGLSIGGMVLALRQHCKIAPLVLFIGAFYVLHLPVIAMARYYVPLVPLLSILASISLLWLGGILRGGAGLHRRRQA